MTRAACLAGLPQALVSSVWTSLLPLVRVGLAQHSRNSSELPTCTPALLAVLPSALQHPTAAIAQSALGFCNSEAFLQKVQAAGLQPPAAVSEALCKAEACLLDSKPRKVTCCSSLWQSDVTSSSFEYYELYHEAPLELYLCHP